MPDPGDKSDLADRDATEGNPDAEDDIRSDSASELDPALVAAFEHCEGTAYHRPSTLETSGTVIVGKYKLIQPIGEGGMGSVWLAEQRQPVKRQVALKLIKSGMDSRSVLARFEAERQALALMEHPNIARILDGGMTESGAPFFVMELVKGIPFTEYCDQARVSLKERLELFIPICSAVQHAHQKGIIHRDLKPSNILISLHDDKPVPKVIDFGLAKAMHHPLTDHSIYTAHGMMVGTPLYMSPEQADLNNLDVDTRTDIYSLGVILYELLTGTTPLERATFKQAAWNEVVRLIKEVDPPRPSTRLSGSNTLPNVAAQRSIQPRQLQKSLSGDLDWIVMKALEKERGRRYETANGLARDVERFLADEAVEACPPSNAYRLSRFIRRNRGKVLAASALFASMILGTLGTSWGLVQARRQAKIAHEESEKKEQALELEAAQRTRAEEREEQAIDAVRKFRDAVENNVELKNNPALEGLRRALLQEPLAYFKSLRERLLSDKDTTPESLHRLAVSAFELGYLSSSIGDKQSALAAYYESLATFERLVTARPTDTDLQKELADVRINIGVLLVETGEPSEAMRAYDQAKQVLQRLVAADPDAKEFQRALARSHHNIGLLLEETGRPTESMAAYEQASKILVDLVSADPSVLEVRSELARCYHNMGNLLSKTGKPTEAMGVYEQAKEIRERLVMDDPVDIIFQRDLAESNNSIGILLRSTGEPTGAIDAYERAREILQRLAATNPSVTAFQNLLARTHNNMGLLLSETGNASEAMKAYEQAKEIQQQLAIANPSVMEFQDNLATTHHNLGKLLGETGRWSEEVTEYEQAIAILDRLVATNPSVMQYQKSLAGTNNSLGVSLMQSGKPTEATEAFKQANEILQPMVAANPSNTQFQDDLAIGYVNIGNMLSETGKPSEAMAAYGQAKAILKRLVLTNPTVTEFQNDLAICHLNIGRLSHDIGKPSEAMTAFAQAEEIQQRLVADNPIVVEFARVLGGILENMAKIEFEQSQFDSAREHLLAAIEWHKRTLTANPDDPICRQLLEDDFNNLSTLAENLGDEELLDMARRGLKELQASVPPFAEP